ncbi:GlsB/YeaQ/YmgE family stress response membrane protein [candidate division KSB1 bacterium]|nr:GlsB/YeaQ/YmgE family stress response membrane protein [bacterium]NUM66189.1 GlsB/YeaQ/YmgE family stress response membrane protein [candidate division KSB1 bacterium]
MLYTILIGLVVGAIAKFIMPGKDPGGIIVTILLGIGGSVLATYLGQWLKIYAEGQTAQFVGSVVGAILILFVYRLLTKKRS